MITAALVAGMLLGFAYAFIVSAKPDIFSKMFFNYLPFCVGVLCLVALLGHLGYMIQV